MATMKKSLARKLLGVLLIISTLFASPSAAIIAPTGRSFSRIYQFGDSLNDAGNLVRENPKAAPYLSFPYGQAIGRATGRASNGLLMVDHIANHFRIPLLRPYLDSGANFSSGVNFAVAGSSALDSQELKNYGVEPHGSPSSLSVQMGWLNSHLESICPGNSECKKEILHDSLIFMGETGGNDYNFALVGQTSMELAQGLVPLVVARITQAVREIIRLGAVRIVVPGNFPIGCPPIYLHQFGTSDPTMYDEMGCLKDFNNFASYHNDLLQEAVEALQDEFPHVTIVYGDYYNGFTSILQNARSNGFTQLHRACCGDPRSTYGFDLARMCGRPGSTVCRNPRAYVSWDGIHLTSRAYYLLADWLLRNNILPRIS